MKIHQLISLFAVVMIILLISCNRTEKPAAEVTEEILPEDIVELRDDQISLAGIELGRIEMRNLSTTLKVNGIVDLAPQNFVTVCATIGGFVKNTSLIPGDIVQKGQVLAIMESQEFVDIQESYLEAKNKLEYTEADFKRHSELYKEDVYSEKNLQLVTSEYKILKAQVRALEQKLALIGVNPADLHEDDISNSVRIMAPISGYIKTVNVNIGKYVSSADVMFEVFNNDNLLLVLTLYDKDADKVSAGQKIRFFINNETEQHAAVIYQTGKSINKDKTYTVHARVTGECENVLPGMYVNAVIEVSGEMISTVPDESIVNFDEHHFIFLFEKDKEEGGRQFTEYRMIEVTKGPSDHGLTGIKLPGEVDINGCRVVIKGAYNLLSAKRNAGEMAC